MSWVVAVVAAVAVGTTVYNGQQQKKALNAQKSALEDAQAADAQQAAAAETDAALSANAATADAKRRRRTNALALGDTSGGTLGGTSVLGAGSATPVASKPAGTALGAGGR